MSDMVERVARAMTHANYSVFEWTEKQLAEMVDRDWYVSIPEAKAAIASIQADAAPVAWMYTHEDGSRFFSSVRQTQPFHDMAPGRKNGWTETPLYTADRIEALTADGARGQGRVEPAKRMERDG